MSVPPRTGELSAPVVDAATSLATNLELTRVAQPTPAALHQRAHVPEALDEWHWAMTGSMPRTRNRMRCPCELCRSLCERSGLRRGRPRLPRIGGIPSTSGGGSVTSCRFALVRRAPSQASLALVAPQSGTFGALTTFRHQRLNHRRQVVSRGRLVGGAVPLTQHLHVARGPCYPFVLLPAKKLLAVVNGVLGNLVPFAGAGCAVGSRCPKGVAATSPRGPQRALPSAPCGADSIREEVKRPYLGRQPQGQHISPSRHRIQGRCGRRRKS